MAVGTQRVKQGLDTAELSEPPVDILESWQRLFNDFLTWEAMPFGEVDKGGR